jgi:hypothetical protein
MNEILFWLEAVQLTPIKFYPYISGVALKVLSQKTHDEQSREYLTLERIGNFVKNQVEAKGVAWDNKVVIQCVVKKIHPDSVDTSNIFIGKYDNIWSIGFGVWSDFGVNSIDLTTKISK